MLKLKVQSEEDHITKRPRGEKTSWFQQEAILQWLEIESNFNQLNGEATKGMKMVVAGAKASALQDKPRLFLIHQVTCISSLCFTVEPSQ